MIEVNGPGIRFHGDFVTIAAEYATLTHSLVENFPDIMDLSTKMIIDISKEVENDKTDINND